MSEDFMSTTTSALKRAAGAFTKTILDGQRYGVHGKAFVCQLCGHDHFKLGGGRSSITALHTLECGVCGHVEFFAKSPPLLKDNAA
jgi:hypothetical protein